MNPLVLSVESLLNLHSCGLKEAQNPCLIRSFVIEELS